MYCGALLYFAISISFFTTIFAVAPNLKDANTIKVHTVPYLNIAIALCVLQVAVTWFGVKVSWDCLQAPKLLRFGSFFCLIGMVLITAAKLILQINAIGDLGDCPHENWKELICEESKTHVCGKGLFLDVHTELYGKRSQFIDGFSMFFVVAFPILQSGYFWYKRFKTHTLLLTIRGNRKAGIHSTR